MDGRASTSGQAPHSQGQHLATISHEGRFWEVHLEFEDDPRLPTSHRARFCFTPADMDEGEEPVRTATVIIEETFEEACRKARSFEEYQLQGFLRSTLP